MTYRVTLFGREIGRLAADRARLTFTYGDEALAEPPPVPLSVRLPVRSAPYGDTHARPFFENLLPEEEYRRLVAAGLGLSSGNAAALLGAIGGECAGAVSIWPAARPPATVAPGYRDLGPDDLRALFTAPGDDALIAAQREGRLSLAGAQAKLTLRHAHDGWQLPADGAPATHILKRTRLGVPHLVENEFFSMRLARAVDMPVPDVEVHHLGIPVLVVRRFDRIVTDRGIERLHQEDFCQGTGVLPQHKYEAEGGPTLTTCADVLRRHSALPIADLELLIRWVGFNYLIGNEDAHGKNLALLYTADGVRLAPFYDLVSSAVYKGLSHKAAMGIGGERRYGYIERRHWERLAESLGLRVAAVRRALARMVDSLGAVLDQTVGSVAEVAGDIPLLEDVRAGVQERLARLSREMP
jgi:serine/threonine-protein kinase HipA